MNDVLHTFAPIARVLLALSIPCAIGACAEDTSPAEEAARDTSAIVTSTGGLKNLAATHHILWGGVAQHTAVGNDATYRSTMARELGVVTPENELKMHYVQPTSASAYNWADADVIVDFVRGKGMSVHGHTLVWHHVPEWVNSVPASKLEGVMLGYINAAATRYKGRIWAWDVVNEALDDDGTLRDSVWKNAIGSGYIATAFRAAHAADPHAKLIYNDYGIQPMNKKSDGLYALVKSLKAAGVPFDGIGIQMHKSIGPFDYGSFTDNMRRFRKLGVEIYITEMDVQIPSATPSAADLAAQADMYWNVLDRALDEPAFKGFQTWGMTDKYSGIAKYHPLPLDASFRPKPAYDALENRLGHGGKSHQYLLVNKSSGKALHVTGNATTNAAPVVEYDPEPGWAAQKWTFDYVGSRSYKIANVNSRLALKVVDGSTSYGATMEQYAVEALDSECWELIAEAGGYYAIRNKNSQRLLAADPGENFSPVTQSHVHSDITTDPADRELWKLQRVSD